MANQGAAAAHRCRSTLLHTLRATARDPRVHLFFKGSLPRRYILPICSMGAACCNARVAGN